MNEPDKVSAWVERAEEDFAIAVSALRRKNPLLYPACFHAQQCAEKYLKSLLIAKEQPFPKTHDLLMLSTLCHDTGILLPFPDEELNALNVYAVLVHYPGENPSLEDTKDALRIARKVRSFVRKFFGAKL